MRRKSGTALTRGAPRRRAPRGVGVFLGGTGSAGSAGRRDGSLTDGIVPFVAVLLGDGAEADDAQRDDELPVEGVDAAAEAGEGHYFCSSWSGLDRNGRILGGFCAGFSALTQAVSHLRGGDSRGRSGEENWPKFDLSGQRRTFPDSGFLRGSVGSLTWLFVKVHTSMLGMCVRTMQGGNVSDLRAEGRSNAEDTGGLIHHRGHREHRVFWRIATERNKLSGRGDTRVGFPRRRERRFDWRVWPDGERGTEPDGGEGGILRCTWDGRGRWNHRAALGMAGGGGMTGVRLGWQGAREVWAW